MSGPWAGEGFLCMATAETLLLLVQIATWALLSADFGVTVAAAHVRSNNSWMLKSDG